MRHTLALFLLVAPAAAMAAPDAAPRPLPSEVRLTDAEKEKLLEEAAARNRDLPALATEPPRRQVSGEAAVSVGSGGYFAGYGTAYVPVGQGGLAIITVGSADHGTRRRSIGPDDEDR